MDPKEFEALRSQIVGPDIRDLDSQSPETEDLGAPETDALLVDEPELQPHREDLSLWERFTDYAFKKAAENNVVRERRKLAGKIFWDTATNDERAAFEKLKQNQDALAANQAADPGWFLRQYADVGNFMPDLYHMGLGIAKRTGIGAAAGGVIGGVVGAAGGPIGIAAGAAAGAAKGAAIASPVATATYFGEEGMYDSFMAQYDDAKERGQELDDINSRTIAVATGGAIGALSMFGLKHMPKALAPITSRAKRIIPGVASKAAASIKSKVASGAIGRVASTEAGKLVVGSGQSAINMAVMGYGNSVALHTGIVYGRGLRENKSAADIVIDLADEVWSLEAAENLHIPAAVEMAKLGVIMHGGMGAVAMGLPMATGAIGRSSPYKSLKGAMAAKMAREGKLIEAIKTTADVTSSFAMLSLEASRMPEAKLEAYERLVRSRSRSTPYEHVFVNMEHWVEFWTNVGEDPRVKFLEVWGQKEGNKYEVASRSSFKGIEVPLPIERYAVTLARTPEYAKYWNGRLKINREGPSAHEINQYLEKEGEVIGTSRSTIEKMELNKRLLDKKKITDAKLHEEELANFRFMYEEAVNGKLLESDLYEAATHLSPELRQEFVTEGFARFLDESAKVGDQAIRKIKDNFIRLRKEQLSQKEIRDIEKETLRIFTETEWGSKLDEGLAEKWLTLDNKQRLQGVIKDDVALAVGLWEKEIVEVPQSPAAKRRAAARAEKLEEKQNPIHEPIESVAVHEMISDMDNLPILATEAEMAAAGIPKSDIGIMSKALSRARTKALELLSKKNVDIEVKRSRKLWNERYNEERKASIEAARNNSQYLAMEILGINDISLGVEIPKIKISGADLSEYVNLNSFKKRFWEPKQSGKGVSVADAANDLGFNSARDLIRFIQTHEPLSEKIHREASELTTLKHGPPLTPQEAKLLAVDSLMENREQLYKAEMNMLSAGASAKTEKAVFERKAPATSEMKKNANVEVNDMPLSVLEDSPHGYWNAVKRIAKESRRLFIEKKDLPSVFAHKIMETQEALKYIEARKAVGELKELQRFSRQLESQEFRRQIAKAGSGILEHMEAALHSIGMRKKGDIVELIKSGEALGIEIPPELGMAANRPNVGQMRAAVKVIKQLRHLAETYNKLSKEASVRTVEEGRAIVQGALERFTGKRIIDEGGAVIVKATPDTVRLGREVMRRSGIREVDSWLLGPEFFFNSIGIDFDSPFANLFHGRELKARERKFGMRKEYYQKLEAIVNRGIPKKRKLSMFREDKADPFIDSAGQVFTLEERIMILLHSGSAEGREALHRGNGITQEMIAEIREKSDVGTIKMVDEIHGLFDSLWPIASDLHRATTGIVAEKREGKYSPLAHSFKERPAGFWGSQLRNQTNTHSINPMTKASYLKKVKGTERQPLRLDLSVINEHINEVIHDISYREATMDMGKLLADQQIVDMITNNLGPERLELMKDWVKAISGEPTNMRGFGESFMRSLRYGKTASSLLFAIPSFYKQFIGMGPGTRYSNAKYMAEAVFSAYGSRNPAKFGELIKSVHEESPAMESRFGGAWSNETYDFFQGMGLIGKRGETLVDRFVEANAHKLPAKALDAFRLMRHPKIMRNFMLFTGLGQHMTDIPIWLASKKYALDGHVRGVKAGDVVAARKYADSAVRRSQGSGEIADRARITRVGELARLFTLFYTPISARYNQLRELKQEYSVRMREAEKFGGKAHVVGSTVTAFGYLYLFPMMMEEALSSHEVTAEEVKKASVAYGMETVPLGREAASLMRWGRVSVPPYLELIDASARLGIKTHKVLDHEASWDSDQEQPQFTKTDLNNLMKFIGVGTGLPTRALMEVLIPILMYQNGELGPMDIPLEAFKAGQPKPQESF
jgi:hypothetical protein